MLAAVYADSYKGPQPYYMCLWSMRNGEHTMTITAPAWDATAFQLVRWSPDGTMVAASTRQALHIWFADSGVHAACQRGKKPGDIECFC